LQRLGIEAIWTDDPDLLLAADKVIFPGVGEASSAMYHLHERGLDEVLRSLRQPVLGICLGLQLFCRHSEEGNTTCLGIFDVEVRRFHGAGARLRVPNSGLITPITPIDPIDHIDHIHLKVPHIGWNTLSALHGPLFEGLQDENYVYFVHSFYAELHSDTIAQTGYGVPFSAALQRDNFYAVQFHPEKSGPVGQRILNNFLNL
jgi:glutamine amidotransferase